MQRGPIGRDAMFHNFSEKKPLGYCLEILVWGPFGDPFSVPYGVHPETYFGPVRDEDAVLRAEAKRSSPSHQKIPDLEGNGSKYYAH